MAATDVAIRYLDQVQQELPDLALGLADAYQEAPAHQVFIDENQANWAGVRVFDSAVTGGAR